MLIVLVAIINIVYAADDSVAPWLSKYLSSPIEYNVHNEVAIVYNTKINFDEFWKEIKPNVTDESAISRVIVREYLSKYFFPKILIDPIKPGDEHLYNAEYEHKKEVFGHKAIKDYIMKQKKESFSKEEI